MRELVRAGSEKEVEKKVAQKKKGGWRQISDIKLDPSLVSYNVIEYVCVMEHDEKEHNTNKWGRRYHVN